LGGVFLVFGERDWAGITRTVTHRVLMQITLVVVTGTPLQNRIDTLF